MTEIERIIDTVGYCKFIPPQDKESPIYKNLLNDLAKAIEQYVIKARIEELNRIKKCDYEVYFNERIAELKAALQGDKE